MDREFQAVLDSLPGKAAASLEEYRELICEIRKRGLTYREIAAVLADRFQVNADLGAIHDAIRGPVRRRRLPIPRPRAKVEAAPAEAKVVAAPAAAPVAAQAVVPVAAQAVVQPETPVVRRFPAAVARPQVRKETGKPVFEYDENEPLRLVGVTK